MTEPQHVLVPAFVGLDVARAHDLARTAGVAVVNDDGNALPPAGLISAQRPKAGTQVFPGDPVTLLVDTDSDDDGGGGGGSAPRPDGPRPRDPAGVK